MTGSCTQWEIYDEYIKDLERQKREEAMKTKGAKKATGPAGPGGESTSKSAEPVPPLQNPEMGRSIKIVDRMVNQNMFEEISMDFKYWEDVSDAFR